MRCRSLEMDGKSFSHKDCSLVISYMFSGCAFEKHQMSLFHCQNRDLVPSPRVPCFKDPKLPECCVPQVPIFFEFIMFFYGVLTILTLVVLLQ